MSQLLRAWVKWRVLLGLGLSGILSGPGLSQMAADHVSGELIVRFRQPPTKAQLAGLRNQIPEIVQWRALMHAPHPKNDPTRTHPLAFVRIAELCDDAHSDAVELAGLLASSQAVEHAEPCIQVELTTDRAFGYPNDPLFSEQWAPQRIDAPAAWEITEGRESVVVAVLDCGIPFEHEEFQDGAIWANPGEIPKNGIDDDANGYVDDIVGWDFGDNDNWPEELIGHGGPVAGVIGARLNNGVGIAGLANVSLMILKHNLTIDGIIASIYYAVDNGAHVINMSFSHAHVKEVEAALQYAWDHDVTSVTSAGNESCRCISFPAGYPTVIAVSSTTVDDELSDHSSYGPWIDVGAPGLDVLSCWGLGYRLRGGTSIASPHVAGLAALVLSADPVRKPSHVRGFIRAYADDIGEPGVDELFGHGRINAGQTIAAVAHALDCPGDVTGNGNVDWQDLIAVLATWGTDKWRADVDSSGLVEFEDLVLVLSEWGPCE